jgi:4-hydroxy-4-methyl-2-oxoglutarate aldolase
VNQSPMSEFLSQLGTAYSAVVSDALDRLGFRGQALAPEIVPMYPGAFVVGRAVPVRVETTQNISENPYEGDMRMLESLQSGDVPVLVAPVDNRAALWGELFSSAAQRRGARGAIASGYVRDTRKIGELGFPVFASGRSPLDTMGRAEVVDFGIELACGSVRIAPGDYLIADDDGVVVIPERAIEDVLAQVGKKVGKEGEARADLMGGQSIREVWNKYGVL